MAILITGMFGPSGGAGSFNLYDPADMAAGDLNVILTLIAGGKITANGINGMIVLQTGAVAPTHTADVGTPYFDTVLLKLHVNNDGATGWTEIGSGGGGSALTVQEEDGAPIDTAITIIRVPNGSMVDNGVGDVSLQQVHELLFFSPDARVGDLQPYIPIRFNGSGATARSVTVVAKTWGYGTFVLDCYKATQALPTYAFASILSTPITVAAGAMTFGGLEYATITPGVIGTSALAADDVIKMEFTSSNGAVNVSGVLTVTAP